MARTSMVDIVVAEIMSVGLQAEVLTGGKHPKVRFWVGERRYTYVVAATTSDYRAGKNCRSGARRLIRQALEENDLPLPADLSKQRARKGAR